MRLIDYDYLQQELDALMYHFPTVKFHQKGLISLAMAVSNFAGTNPVGYAHALNIYNHVMANAWPGYYNDLYVRGTKVALNSAVRRPNTPRSLSL